MSQGKPATGHPEPFFLNHIEGDKTMIEETNIELEVEEMEQMDAPGIMLGD
jgi:hypothetical protein